jgi:hypothetical protein
MFYIPQNGDTRYKRKIVLSPININGVRYAWQIIYVKQYHGTLYWHDDYVVSKETYLKWKHGN